MLRWRLESRGQQHTQGQHSGTARIPCSLLKNLGRFQTVKSRDDLCWVVSVSSDDGTVPPMTPNPTNAVIAEPILEEKSSSDNSSENVLAGVGLGIDVEVLGRVQQLQAQLDGDVHVGHVLLVPVTVPVVEVLDYLFEHGSTVGGLSVLVVRLVSLSFFKAAKAVRSDQV